MKICRGSGWCGPTPIWAIYAGVIGNCFFWEYLNYNT